jgi:hypothetical protein
MGPEQRCVRNTPSDGTEVTKLVGGASKTGLVDVVSRAKQGAGTIAFALCIDLFSSASTGRLEVKLTHSGDIRVIDFTVCALLHHT